MSEFKGTTHQGEGETTTASGQLPGLTIEIVRRRSAAGDAELISINMQAVPSFEAFGRALEGVNPLAFWTEAARLAWLPWLEATRTMLLPWSRVPLLPRAFSTPTEAGSEDSHSTE